MNRISKRAHPVVAEALPHLGEEERRQPARMAEERAVVRGEALATATGMMHGKNTMIVSE